LEEEKYEIKHEKQIKAAFKEDNILRSPSPTTPPAYFEPVYFFWDKTICFVLE
jgi:hypothetical protein